ncbi:hypothetical protein AKO1_008205 [Acrasis kona]|uniref:Potassium channel domain-containing protein n=1 Tax=Acrasis kona TaxID=1008807 RepID=A0AAW2YN49_9EUKA
MAHFCHFCQCSHDQKKFKSNYMVSPANIAFSTIVPDWKEVSEDERLLVCDASVTVVINRYNNNRDKRDVRLPTIRMMCSYTPSILIILFVVLAFFCLTAVPIWMIESKMTPNVEEVTRRNITSPSAIKEHQKQWTYGSSIYYMVVTQTTIGYGDRIPLTVQGRIYLQFVSMIGLSLVGTLIAMMTNLVFKYARLVSLFMAIQAKKFTSSLFNWFRGDNYHHVPTNIKVRGDLLMILNPLEKRIFFFFSSHAMHIVFVFVGVWIYIFVGAAVMMNVEGWDYFTSEWFCFVTLTTIGYGDVTPVTQLGKGLASVYAVLGFGMLAILFGLIGRACVEFGQHGWRSFFVNIEHFTNNKHHQRDEKEHLIGYGTSKL